MKKSTWILAGFILVKFLIQYSVIAPIYELHRDEFLHLDQGKHLDWGFVSVPPVTSWFSWIIMQLGGGEFWVKFFPALFGAATIAFAWKIVEELKGGLFAQVMTAVTILLSAILRINTLFQPNSFDILAWTALYYFLVCFVNRGESRYLVLAGMTAGIGFLNKYSIVFLLIGLFVAFMLSPQRRMLWRKQTAIAMMVALIIVAPNLLWQINRGFPVVHHMQELAETQLVNVNRGDFIKEQILFFLGSCWLFVFAIYGLARNPNLSRFRWIGYSYIITIGLFLYLRAKGYYAIGLYPVLLAIGSVQLEHTLSAGRWRYLRPVFPVLIIALFVPFIKIVFPVLTPEQIHANDQVYRSLGLLRWEDGKEHPLPQDFADMLGWKELAHKVDSSYSALNGKGYTLVLCDNYGQAGAINHYSNVAGMQAVSMNADYINWIPYKENIRNLILVQDHTDDDTARTRERQFFKSVIPVGEITNSWAREKGTRIYSCTDATIAIGPILEKEAEDHMK